MIPAGTRVPGGALRSSPAVTRRKAAASPVGHLCPTVRCRILAGVGFLAPVRDLKVSCGRVIRSGSVLATSWRPGVVTGYGDVAACIRLVNVVDIDDGPAPLNVPVIDDPASEASEPGLAPLGIEPRPDDPSSMSISAVHLTVLQDGQRLTLLDSPD